MKREIYVATSWRNALQPSVVAALRGEGHSVYDFREPLPDIPNSGFSWSQIDREWQDWGLAQFVHQLEHPIAAEAFKRDRDALDWCDTCVLLLPSGRSAHLEAGYAAGKGKAVIVMLSAEERLQPELMYLLAPGAGGVRFVTNTQELLAALRTYEQDRGAVNSDSIPLDAANRDPAARQRRTAVSGDDDRIHELAERALELANNDIALAVRILAETGISLAAAFEAIDAVMPVEVSDGADKGELA